MSDGFGDDSVEVIWIVWLIKLALAHHSMGFPTASLSISEDCPIISLQDAFNKRKPTIIVDFLLFGVFTENGVEGVGFGRC